MSLNDLDLIKLDDVIRSYDIADDPVLTDEWRALTVNLHNRLKFYGKGCNDYGKNQLWPHLQRISKDGKAFLKYLGWPDNVGRNFYDAYILSDLGKTDERYDPLIWSLPHRPTNEERQMKRKHAEWGVDVLSRNFSKLSETQKSHPHISYVIPALTAFHHERLDGKGTFSREEKDMGQIIQIAAIVDAYDGDRIKRPHQETRRTPEETLDRMAAIGEGKKYAGAFDKKLLSEYRQYKLENL
ncbi:MAG: hypothetical protein CL565_00415 [Alphaproteobacteria bacterium]|nr:hypothetical protein [Alphaproteobacteria bacterium]|tara:strand:+ start:1761 stop:2483 length:723 start_codon:yes stop_codon:yes gene_type:complete